MLASDSPTYLLRISGPLTTFGSLAFSILPICLAISVLPQPGGPYRRMPFTCLQPRTRENKFRGGSRRRGQRVKRELLLTAGLLLQLAETCVSRSSAPCLYQWSSNTEWPGWIRVVPLIWQRPRRIIHRAAPMLSPVLGTRTSQLRTGSPNYNFWLVVQRNRDHRVNRWITLSRSRKPTGWWSPGDADHPRAVRGCRCFFYTPIRPAHRAKIYQQRGTSTSRIWFTSLCSQRETRCLQRQPAFTEEFQRSLIFGYVRKMKHQTLQVSQLAVSSQRQHRSIWFFKEKTRNIM